jgi:hypothetical protein
MNVTEGRMTRHHEGRHEQTGLTTVFLTGDVSMRAGTTGPAPAWYSTAFLPGQAPRSAASGYRRNPAECAPAKPAASTDEKKGQKGFFEPNYDVMNFKCTAR